MNQNNSITKSEDTELRKDAKERAEMKAFQVFQLNYQLLLYTTILKREA
jgi:hypothetical protein